MTLFWDAVIESRRLESYQSLYVSFQRNSKFLLSLFTGLKSGATICIAPPELVLTVLLYFIRALWHKSVNYLLKHAIFCAGLLISIKAAVNDDVFAPCFRRDLQIAKLLNFHRISWFDFRVACEAHTGRYVTSRRRVKHSGERCKSIGSFETVPKFSLQFQYAGTE